MIMKKYIAILRGINVSGQKKIKMDQLRSMMEELNFHNIQTYNQSGNNTFYYKKVKTETVEKLIKKKIFDVFGFNVTVIVRNPEEIKEVLENNPFLKDKKKDITKMYVTFLSDKPLKENINKLKEYNYSPEEYLISGKDIYFYTPNGYGRAKMNNNFFENKLKVSATTRNWKTVNKLFEISIQN